MSLPGDSQAKGNVVPVSRVLVFATAVSLVVTACAGTEADTTGTTRSTNETAVVTTSPPQSQIAAETTGATHATSTNETAVVTTSLPPSPLEMERVAHGPWFEGWAFMTSVTAGGPGVVAVGGAGDAYYSDAAVWTSPDGHTWARVDGDPAVFGDESSVDEAKGNQIIMDVVSGPLGVVAVGTDGVPPDYDAAVWLSADGLTWERLPHDEEVFGGIGDQFMASVVQTPGAVVVVGESAGHATVWVSRDGKIWTRAQIDGESGDTAPSAMFDVAVGGPGLVAVGSVGFESRPAVWLSAEGATWTRLPDSISGDSSGVEGAESTPGRMTLVAAAEGGSLIAVAATEVSDWLTFGDPAMWTSSDGFEWRMINPIFVNAPTSFSTSLGDVAWDNERLVAVGEQPDPAGWFPSFAMLWVSVDGGMTWHAGSGHDVEVWSDLPLPVAPGATHLTRFGSSFVVVGNDAVPTDRIINGYVQYAWGAAVWMASLTES